MVVVLDRVSRSNSLKIPKELEIVVDKLNSKEDYKAVQEAMLTYENKKFDSETISHDLDKDLNIINKIPSNASELMVITVIKKLFFYIALVTEKSPKKFRVVFVNRMQNHVLDALEDLLKANFIRMNSIDKKQRRENFQQDAIVKLKMVGYISMISESVGCILPKQYKQISLQTAEAINLIAAWKKSDDVRWKNINKGF